MLKIYNMLYWTFKWVIISLVLIFLIHYLYSFFKNMLTIPKIKDLVNKPIAQYNEITIPEKKENKEEKQNMENELQNFLKDLKKPEAPASTILSANEINNDNAFSSY